MLAQTGVLPSVNVGSCGPGSGRVMLAHTAMASAFSLRPSPPRGRRPGPKSSLTTSASMRSGLSIQGHQPTSPAGWAIIVDSLRRADVQLLSPQEVQHALQAGTQCVVDVRLPAEFEAGHVSGTVNVPFFRPISGWDAVRVLRRLAFALFGIRTGTELNPLFVEEVSRVAADSSKGIILMCNIGGVIEHSGSFKVGTQSRSLTAAHVLVESGKFGSIKVLKGGVNGWAASERPIEEM
ncbi:hypothetical protein ACKKBF_B33925 [Auxenochlorella protothecoides x Auxenochlorella symbiontica]